MIVKSLKAELSESAQNKLEAVVAEAVEKKLKKEVKKVAKKLTVRFIVTGVVLAGVCIVAGNSDKIVNYFTKRKN